MKEPLETSGLTIQLGVPDLAAGHAWYVRLLGRPPDRERGDGVEWEILPNCWLRIAVGLPTPHGGPLRLGVRDIEEARPWVADALGITVSPTKRVPGVAAWCDFADPFGNRLGLVQDLADVTTLM